MIGAREGGRSRRSKAEARRGGVGGAPNAVATLPPTPKEEAILFEPPKEERVLTPPANDKAGLLPPPYEGAPLPPTAHWQHRKMGQR
jgi:hypothetical protein